MTNTRTILQAAIAAVLLCATGAANPASQLPTPSVGLEAGRQASAMQRYIGQADAAILAAEGSDAASAPAAAKTIAALIQDPLFTQLTTASQGRMLSAHGLALWRKDDLQGARDRFLDATRVDGNDVDAWYRLAVLEHDLGHRVRSAHYATTLVRRWPEVADNLSRQWLNNYIFPSDPAAQWRTALLQALFDAGWTDRHNGTDAAWRELALAHLGNSDTDGAAKVVARIRDPMVLIQLRTDKRFDAVSATLDTLPSTQEASAQEVDTLRRRVAEEPRRVDLLSTFASALLVAGRHEEALAAIDALLAAIDSGDPASFERLEEEKVWVVNQRAIALRRLGRIDEALATIEEASRLQEFGDDNVSQVLNMAYFQCQLGRPADARRTLERVGVAVSGYGRMVLEGVRHCAAVQAGDRAAADAARTYLQAHRDDAATIVIEALLHEGRLDDAAALLIEELDQPKNRLDALDFVQTFRRSPELPGERTLRANHRALLARADVRAAVDRVGRMETHEVFNVGGIE